MTPHTRITGTVAAAALTLGVLVTAAPAPAVDLPAASSNSQWLVSKLDADGHYANPLSGGVDYGLMIDALYAVHASGQPQLATPILNAINADGALSYISYYSFLGEDGAADRIGGATAKTLLAAEVAGADIHDFGGLDMVAETKGVIVKAEDFQPGGRFTADGEFPDSGLTVADVGRVADYGPHISYNNANTFGQILATIALARAGALTQPVVDKLLWQQCPEGYFRIFYYAEDCAAGQDSGFSPPDGDTTGFALSALLAAQRAGVAGLDDDIQRAVDWLVANQKPGGGWGGGVGTENPNTNSTGLIVQALADADQGANAVAMGEAYLESAQATAAADSGNALRNDLGAIAYNPADYHAAKASGIGSLDTWIRASAQASLGISQVGFWELSDGPRRTFSVSTPGGYVRAGSQVTVAATGLAPGERYRLAVDGQQLATGRADGSGSLSEPVTVPGSSDATQQVTVTGGEPGRTGSATLMVLGGKQLTAAVAKKKIVKGKKVKLSVIGLAAGEQVTVTAKGRVVATGVAGANGTFAKKIKLKKVGVTVLTVTGAFANRIDTVKVKVVKKPKKHKKPRGHR
jgi:hypothetical protein